MWLLNFIVWTSLFRTGCRADRAEAGAETGCKQVTMWAASLWAQTVYLWAGDVTETLFSVDSDDWGWNMGGWKICVCVFIPADVFWSCYFFIKEGWKRFGRCRKTPVRNTKQYLWAAGAETPHTADETSRRVTDGRCEWLTGQRSRADWVTQSVFQRRLSQYPMTAAQLSLTLLEDHSSGKRWHRTASWVSHGVRCSVTGRRLYAAPCPSSCYSRKLLSDRAGKQELRGREIKTNDGDGDKNKQVGDIISEFKPCLKHFLFVSDEDRLQRRDGRDSVRRPPRHQLS